MGDLWEPIGKCPIVSGSTTPEKFWPKDGGTFVIDGRLNYFNESQLIYQRLRNKRDDPGVHLED